KPMQVGEWRELFASPWPRPLNPGAMAGRFERTARLVIGLFLLACCAMYTADTVATSAGPLMKATPVVFALFGTILLAVGSASRMASVSAWGTAAISAIAAADAGATPSFGLIYAGLMWTAALEFRTVPAVPIIGF